MSQSTVSETIARGVSAHQAGRLDEALACYRAALAAAPNDAEASSLCGLALVHLDRAEQALPLLLRAVELEPGETGFRLNLAEGLQKANRHDQALRELQIVNAADPGNARAWARAGEALIARRDWPALQATAAAWTRAHPASEAGWRIAARAAFEQGRHVEAVGAFAHVLTPGSSAVDLTSHATLCLHALDSDAATTALDRAEALDPDYAPMLSTRALLLMYLGRFEEAESYCHRCLARDPLNVPAYTTLSRLRAGHLSDAELTAVTATAQRRDIHLDRRIPAAFAVAHARDASDDVDAAFAAYEYAHGLALERDLLEKRSYDPTQIDRRIRRIIALSAALPTVSRPANAPRPIFIVGMPRSGTTLTESVLAAHSRVFACGERTVMPQILHALLELDAAGRMPDAPTLQEWATGYFSDLKYQGDADHVTDKHPLNFEAAGLIAHLLPDAVIVHVRRNPVETGLSIFRQEFNKHWAFAHRLADIGHYYGHYARLVAHWERALPGQFTTIQYEDFVENFDRTAPELVRACGLGWEPQCRDFQSTPRAIATFSTVQARDPVKLANGRARRYGKHLTALVAALRLADVDLETGALQAQR